MQKALRPCKHPGCPELTRETYCEAHKTEARDYERNRGSASARGYDKRWEKFRLYYLKHNPLCVDHLDRGECVPATEVHHIKKLRYYPELKYDNDNLMALCHECHSKRTSRGE